MRIGKLEKALTLSLEELERRKLLVRDKWGLDSDLAMSDWWWKSLIHSETMLVVYQEARWFLQGRTCEHNFYYFERT